MGMGLDGRTDRLGLKKGRTAAGSKLFSKYLLSYPTSLYLSYGISFHVTALDHPSSSSLPPSLAYSIDLSMLTCSFRVTTFPVDGRQKSQTQHEFFFKFEFNRDRHVLGKYKLACFSCFCFLHVGRVDGADGGGF